jgi:hypothetical protein
MSTAHIYGDPPTVTCTEDSPFGYGFAPFVGRAWESEFEQNALPAQRCVVLRTGFVIGRDCGAGGGALARLLTLVRFGLGGTVGSGTQGMSWIHEADLNRLFERALTNDRMQGVYIAASPNPVSQREFMTTLRRVVGMPLGLPAFSWMVRIGAPLFMRTDPELALYGRYVVSKRYCLHRPRYVNRAHAHESIGCLRYEAGDLVVGYHCPLGADPCTNEADRHASFVHTLDRLSQRDFGRPSQGVFLISAGPAPERIKNRILQVTGRRMLCPGINNHLAPPTCEFTRRTKLMKPCFIS